jgi:transposase
MDFAVSRLPPRHQQYQKRGNSSYKDFRLIVAFQGARMRQKSGPVREPAEKVVKDIRRMTRRKFSAEEKIRIVLEGLRGEESIAELCRREGIVQNLYYRWSKDFLEAGKKRLADGARSNLGRGQRPSPRGVGSEGGCGRTDA